MEDRTEVLSAREYKEQQKLKEAKQGALPSPPKGEGVVDFDKLKKSQAKAKESGPPYPLRQKKVMTVAGRTYHKDPVTGHWIEQLTIDEEG